MKNFILLLVIVIGAVYAYHWYTEQHAPPPVEVQEATPTPPPRRATPTPRPALQTTGLQTHSLDRHGPGTPGASTNPLNAPHR
jgi:hypothetical protein